MAGFPDIQRNSLNRSVRHAWGMDEAIGFRLACVRDVASIQNVEVDAGQRFRSVAMPQISEDRPPDGRLLRQYIADAQLWVGTHGTAVIGYAMAQRIDDHAHIDQVSVMTAFSGQRIGARLLEIACDWARLQEAWRTTLFTYESVPWNAPYYRSLGFAECGQDSMGPGLRKIWDMEVRTDLADWTRVALARRHC